MICAKLDSNNIVLEEIIADNVQWCIDNLGGLWVEDIDNTGSIGFTWLSDRRIFKPFKPYSSWTYNEENNTWVAPKPKPDNAFCWSEEQGDWVVVS